LLLILLPEKHY